MAIGALLFGALIGLSLGALGGGGSILTVPVLVYALGERAQEATTASLVIVGITSAVAALGHARSGRVQWKAGTAFGACGIAASFLGAYLNRSVAPNLLLLAFAALMLFAAAAMAHQVRQVRQVYVAAPAPTRELATVGGPAPQSVPTGISAGVRPPTRTHTIAKLITAGLLVGFVTGFLGVGGGFIIVPALTVALRFKMPTAVGTSLLVIAINSATALLARVGHENFHWAVIVPFAAAAVVASFTGKHIAERMSADSLTRAFAAFLVLVALYVGVRSGASL